MKPKPPKIKPFSYYGGKQKIARHIVATFPEHRIYVEPFAGGLAVLCAKGRPEHLAPFEYVEIVNDKDQELIAMWRALRDDPEFAHQVYFTPHSRADYHLSLSDGSAWSTYVKISQGFANKKGCGWAMATRKSLALQLSNRVHNLPHLIERMRDVTIECDDALNVIKRYDGPETFFYCDPPYPNTHQGHYAGYTLADLQALVDTLAECQGAAVLSNYHQQSLIVPATWERREIRARCTAAMGGNKGKGGERTEVLWIKPFTPSGDNTL